MDDRKQQILKAIIDHYVKTVQPIGSKFLAESGLFRLSPATIRNEMAELEEQGYIFHPHTSAGRIPTERGYQFYIETFLIDGNLNKKFQDKLAISIGKSKKYQRDTVKSVAKEVAEMTEAAVFIAFAHNDFYYTGLSNLFAQPEFIEQRLVHSMSQVIDHLDLVIHKLFDDIDETVSVTVGGKNPFSSDCGSVMVKYSANREMGVLGVLGPLRMDYQHVYNVVKHSQQLINKMS